jgi:voltage-gated potassium channel
MSAQRESPQRTPQRLQAMAARDRRRAVMMTTGRSVLAFGVVLGVYFLLPVGEWASDAATLVRLALGVLFFGAVLAWQIRQILRSSVPALQAVEALIVAIPTFIAVYASTYLSVEGAAPGSFSAPLDKPAALYFTIVTLGTVGYGDIAPVTTAARMAVSSQILLDLVLIAVVLRLLTGAARRSLDRRREPPAAAS